MTGHSRKRAFSLIEAAIVLGVVGLVIGVIWISAASIRAKIRANNVVYMVNQTIEVYRKYAKETPADDIIRLMNGTLLQPGFTYTSNAWGSNMDIIHGNGVILYGFYNWYHAEDGLYGDILFSGYENYNVVPQPETCLALYKYFVAQNWSPIITPGLSLSGGETDFNPTLDNDISAVATACKTAESFSFYGLYP